MITILIFSLSFVGKWFFLFFPPAAFMVNIFLASLLIYYDWHRSFLWKKYYIIIAISLVFPLLAGFIIIYMSIFYWEERFFFLFVFLFCPGPALVASLWVIAQEIKRKISPYRWLSVFVMVCIAVFSFPMLIIPPIPPIM